MRQDPYLTRRDMDKALQASKFGALLSKWGGVEGMMALAPIPSMHHKREEHDKVRAAAGRAAHRACRDVSKTLRHGLAGKHGLNTHDCLA